jgi:hypothetical protein
MVEGSGTAGGEDDIVMLLRVTEDDEELVAPLSAAECACEYVCTAIVFPNVA